VAPGVAYQLIRDREDSTSAAQPIKNPEPALRYAGRVILASAAFTFVSVSLLAIIRAQWPSLMPDPGKWLANPSTYLATNYRLVVRTVLLECLLALLAAIGYGLISRRYLPPAVETSGWFHLFRAEVPSRSRPFVKVKLKDGTEHYGYVRAYSTTMTPADRELVLASPLRYRESPKTPDSQSSNEPETIALDTAWQRVSLSGSEIEAIWVSYVSDDTTEQVQKSEAAAKDKE
jgi:Family of unknown function (DUF6338)